jgi:hypothetical protein
LLLQNNKWDSSDFVDECNSAGYSLPEPSITVAGQKTSVPGRGPFSEIKNDVLATGAIIGIAVGVPVGSIIIIGVFGLILAFRVKNRRKKMLAGYFALHPDARLSIV